MDQFGWNGTAAVDDWLAAEPYRFEFVQAVRLLDAAQAEGVRLGARGGFSFPPSEVRSLHRATNGRPAEMTVAFLSLDGAFGPLPTAYAEERLRSDRSSESAFGEFLNLFHHRLLRLLYRIAQIHRPALGRANAENPLGGMLMAIAGLHSPALRDRLATPDGAIPRYASLLGRQSRSAHGLAQMLADFTGQAARTREFFGRWMSLGPAQRTRLGQGSANRSLGAGATLGSRSWVDGAAIEVVLGSAARPLGRSLWLELLPGGWRHAPIADLVRLYVRSEICFRIRLVVAAAAIAPSWLGAARLGYTSFLVTRPAREPAEVLCGGEALHA